MTRVSWGVPDSGMYTTHILTMTYSYLTRLLYLSLTIFALCWELHPNTALVSAQRCKTMADVNGRSSIRIHTRYILCFMFAISYKRRNGCKCRMLQKRELKWYMNEQVQ